MTRVRQTLAPHEILHLLVFSIATLLAGRFIVWASLYFALFLPRAVHRRLLSDAAPFENLAAAAVLVDRRRTLVAAVITFTVTGACLFSPRIIAQPSIERCSRLAPVIEEYQRIKRPSDRLFNDDVMGSCTLLYASQEKVFIDTRFDFYGHPRTIELANAMRLRGDWKAAFDRWDIDTVVIRNDLPLAKLLEVSGNFDELYRDGNGSIFRRRQADE
jgi:hypothetical protein